MPGGWLHRHCDFPCLMLRARSGRSLKERVTLRSKRQCNRADICTQRPAPVSRLWGVTGEIGVDKIPDTMEGEMLRLILGLVFAFVLCACSTTAVRCDKHLQPINAPKSP